MAEKTIGRFRIVDRLGAGGMGQVYKAIDTRLNRTVAIKTLLPDKVSDPERKRRFIQEAQAASALNHPTIVVIHEIGEEDGIDYIVMEYIEGKTLDALIPRGGMKLGEALRIGSAIADGLAKAHAAGIVHRDLKPSNVMVGDDGRVKVLDFGLAKLTEVASVGEVEATMTVRPETEDGVIVGTTPYMSPEQAEGKKLDGRSDIFSLGAVLYEMVSGRRAFSGQSRTAILSAILREERGLFADSKSFFVPSSGGSARQIAPELGWAGYPVWSPDGKFLLLAGMDGMNAIKSLEFWIVPVDGAKPVRTSILKSLREKNVGGTFPLVNWSGSGLMVTHASEVWTFKLDESTWTLRDLSRVAGGGGLLAGVQGSLSKFAVESGATGFHLWRLPMDMNSSKITGPLENVVTGGGDQAYPAASLDGNVLAYVQMFRGAELRVRNFTTGRETVLANGYVRPRVSPDGSKVAYSVSARVAGRGLFMADAAGGPGAELLSENEEAMLYGWTGDGAKLVYWHGSPIQWSLFDLRSRRSNDFRISTSTKAAIHGIEFSPDGKWIAFHLFGSTGGPVMVSALRNGSAAPEGEWTLISEQSGINRRPWWSPDGNTLYFLSDRDGNICMWGRRLNSATKQPSGSIYPVHHFHERRRLIPAAPFGPAISKSWIIFALQERTSNIWIGEQEKP